MDKRSGAGEWLQIVAGIGAVLIALTAVFIQRKDLSRSQGPIINENSIVIPSGDTDSYEAAAQRVRVLDELIEREIAGQRPSDTRGSGTIARRLTDQRDLELAIANLRGGNLAYNAPEKMKTGQIFRIMSRIGSDKVSIQALKADIPTGPNIKTDTVPTPVTTKMKMTLKGSEFDITPLSSEEQFVAGDSPTTWEWDIAPKHSGKLGLHLAAVVELNGMSKDYKTVDRDIVVAVDPVDASEKFLKENWQWILTALGISGGGGGVLAFIRSRRKQAGSGTILMP